MKEQTRLHIMKRYVWILHDSTSCSEYLSLTHLYLYQLSVWCMNWDLLLSCALPVSLTSVTVVPLSLLAWSLQSHHIVDQANAMSCFRYCLSYSPPPLEDRTSCLPPTAHIWRCADMIRTIIPIVPSFLWEMWLAGLDTVSRIWQPRQVLQTTS